MLEEFDIESSNILSWLETVDKFVKDESYIPVGDVDTLEAKLVQSNVSSIGRSLMYLLFLAGLIVHIL